MNDIIGDASAAFAFAEQSREEARQRNVAYLEDCAVYGRRLVAEGYYQISRQGGTVARVDVPDVRLALRQMGHERLSEAAGWAVVDHWLRCHSKDTKKLYTEQVKAFRAAGGGSPSSKYHELNDLYGYGWPEPGHVFVPMPDGSMKDLTIEHLLSAVWTARPVDRDALRAALEADPRWGPPGGRACLSL